jgi:uncharacterized repeat protein (TIGR04076 family)
MMNTPPGQGMLDLLQEWQCPDPLSRVIFRIEEIPDSGAGGE